MELKIKGFQEVSFLQFTAITILAGFVWGKLTSYFYCFHGKSKAMNQGNLKQEQSWKIYIPDIRFII